MSSLIAHLSFMARISTYMADSLNETTKRVIKNGSNGKKIEAIIAAVNKIEMTTVTENEEGMATKVVKEKLNDEKNTMRPKIENNDKIVEEDFELKNER